MTRDEIRNDLLVRLEEDILGKDLVMIRLVSDINAYDGYFDNIGAYEMYMFDDMFYDKLPLEVIELVDHDNFDTSDDYFKENAYGWIVSLSEMEHVDDITDVLEEVVEHMLWLLETGTGGFITLEEYDFSEDLVNDVNEYLKGEN